MRRRRRSRPAFGMRIFSPSELLVVLGIICIMASLLLPALATAKGVARQ